MAVLRAGPFGSESGYGSMHQDEPASAQSDPLPVNCALVDWTNDSWRAVKRVRENDGTAVYSYITSPTASSSFTVSGGSFSGLSFNFLYQAAIATSLTVTYSVTSTGFGSDVTVSAFADGVGFTDSKTAILPDETVSISGSPVLTLPIAIRPIRVSITAGASLSGGGTISIAP